MFFPQKVVSPRVSLVCAEEGDGFLNDIMQGCLQIFFVHSVFKNLKSIKMKMKVGLNQGQSSEIRIKGGWRTGIKDQDSKIKNQEVRKNSNPIFFTVKVPAKK